jgi:stage III sporulation protein AD
MDGTKIGALSLLLLVALLLLRQHKPEWAPLLRMAGAILFGGFLVASVGEAMGVIRSLAPGGGGALPEETWAILLKALGLAFLTEITAGICRDSGEAGLASWVEMAGKMEILLLALPLVREVLGAVSSLLGGGSG